MNKTIVYYCVDTGIIKPFSEFELIRAAAVSEIFNFISIYNPFACIYEIGIDDINFENFLAEARQNHCQVILLAKPQYAVDAIKLMQLGAFECLNYPYDLDELEVCVLQAQEKYELIAENKKLHEMLEDRYSFSEIIGISKGMKEIYGLIEKVSSHDVTVLIQGESGTGKELVASALHYQSPRKNRPFIKINCAAIPETLLESELFGYEKGSFTGAIATHEGKFEQAHTGTIFLDEIGDMSLSTQSKVLRLIQEKEIQRVGGSEVKKVDVRIIAATHKDLKAEIKEKRFREDLFYRLNVVNFVIPPLRQRKEDIIILANFFLEKFAKKFGTTVRKISADGLKRLVKYHWPGNVRELENVIERAAVLSSGEQINPDELILSESVIEKKITGNLTLKQAREIFEREFIGEKLLQNGWNMAKTARVLDVERSYLYRKVQALGIERES